MNLEMLYSENRGLLYFWVKRYRPLCADRPIVDVEDLAQAGFLGLCEASATYDPEKGAAWSAWASCCIRNAMRKALGIHSGKMEPLFLSLDDAAYKSDDDSDGATLGDTIADESVPPADENMLAIEMTQAVRDAVEALKDDRQRDFIRGKYFEGLSNSQLSDRLGVNKTSLGHVRGKALLALARDLRLQDYMDEYNFISHKSAAAFHRDMTSDTERLALLAVEKGRRRGKTSEDIGNSKT